VLYITASLLGNGLLQFELPVSFGKQVFFSAGHTASPHFAGTFVMMARICLQTTLLIKEFCDPVSYG
jgi:hypothetical protein